jgi:hypothetical protein
MRPRDQGVLAVSRAQVVHGHSSGTGSSCRPIAREAAEDLLRGMVSLAAGQGTPHGCMTVQGALAASERGRAARDDLAARRRQGEALLAARFRQAGPGELPAGLDAAAVARYVFAVSFGLAEQAAGGATAAELHEAVDVAMSGWPAPPGGGDATPAGTGPRAQAAT